MQMAPSPGANQMSWLRNLELRNQMAASLSAQYQDALLQYQPLLLPPTQASLSHLFSPDQLMDTVLSGAHPLAVRRKLANDVTASEHCKMTSATSGDKPTHQLSYGAYISKLFRSIFAEYQHSYFYCATRIYISF
jgi:hypothetical protein